MERYEENNWKLKKKQHTSNSKKLEIHSFLMGVCFSLKFLDMRQYSQTTGWEDTYVLGTDCKPTR